MYYNPVTGAPQEVPQLFGGIAQAQPSGPVAPQQVRDAGINYSELRKKKAIADALRAKSEKEYTPYDANYRVAGNDTVPEYVGVNWVGGLANMLQPFAQKADERKAAAAEGEAASARDAALQQIMGGVQEGKPLGMEQRIALSELGIKPNDIDPIKSSGTGGSASLGAATQYIQAGGSPKGYEAMMRINSGAPQEGDYEVVDSDAARMAALKNQPRATGSGKAPKPEDPVAKLKADRAIAIINGDQEEAARLDAVLNQIESQKMTSNQVTALTKDTVSEGAKQSWRNAETFMHTKVPEIEGILQKMEDNPLSGVDRTLAAVGQSIPGSFGDLIVPDTLQEFTSYMNELVGDTANEKFVGVLSDSDILLVKSMLPRATQDPETIRALWDITKQAAANNRAHKALEIRGIYNQLQKSGQDYSSLKTTYPGINFDEEMPTYVDDDTFREQALARFQQAEKAAAARKSAGTSKVSGGRNAGTTVPASEGWESRGDGYEYKTVDGRLTRRKVGG